MVEHFWKFSIEKHEQEISLSHAHVCEQWKALCFLSVTSGIHNIDILNRSSLAGFHFYFPIPRKSRDADWNVSGRKKGRNFFTLIWVRASHGRQEGKSTEKKHDKLLLFLRSILRRIHEIYARICQHEKTQTFDILCHCLSASGSLVIYRTRELPISYRSRTARFSAEIFKNKISLCPMAHYRLNYSWSAYKLIPFSVSSVCYSRHLTVVRRSNDKDTHLMGLLIYAFAYDSFPCLGTTNMLM